MCILAIAEEQNGFSKYSEILGVVAIPNGKTFHWKGLYFHKTIRNDDDT